MTTISTVAVLGSGLMGSGIAQTSAAAGIRTIVQDTSETQLKSGQAAIAKSLARFVEKGKLSAEQQAATLAQLTFTTDLAGAAEADFVIEAVTEDLTVKNELWRELDRRCGPATIFASNTSSLSVISMAATTSRPDRFLGLHFFNPVPLMPLVEVVRSVQTSPATFEQAWALVLRLGKQPVAARDASGFIVNLLLIPYLLDAIRALERGVASTVDLDTALRLGAGHPMGPLTLADFVGLDTLARSAEIMHEEYRETRYAPPALLRRMVTAGFYGRKSGRGFYDYRHDPPVATDLGL
ncbi:MAG TPA: 3-hydroxybutyryl-CoA dehydrogenase [Gemmatimonadales bacterium]|jgi:3-hydroxybutyryl-CoA dehydrogenase